MSGNLVKRVSGPLFGIAGVIVLLIAWEFATAAFKIPPFLLPPPSSIVAAVVEVLPAFLNHLKATVSTIVVGFSVALAISLPIGAILASSRRVEAVAMPILVFIQSIPKIALAPILVVALGPNEIPRVIITLLITFFPILIATLTGLMATPRELIDLATTARASFLDRVLLVKFPYAVPYIFSGLKVSATLAVIGAIVSEFVAADKGLGYLLVSATAFYNTPLAYGAMLMLCIIAIVFFNLVSLAQSLLFPWSLKSAER